VESTATGTFTVALASEPVSPDAIDSGLVRLSIAKQFEGDITGVSVGEMLSVGTSVEGSAGYVALERITGTLAGRAGSFALQHSGLMDRGTPTLAVVVVPDSGTGGLAGLAGTFEIEIAGDEHRYVLRYTLPD